MKGQNLFVRPATPLDRDLLEQFFQADRYTPPPSIWTRDGIVAKLVGQIVGYTSIDLNTSGELRIDHLYVSSHLRRKRIGRGILSELERMGRQLGCARLLAPGECAAEEFLLRTGFVRRDGLLQKKISETS